MNTLLLKKLMLVMVNVFVSLVAGEVGIRFSRHFIESNVFYSVIIILLAAFLISAFCLNNAYVFSQKFEQKKSTPKQAIIGTLSLWALISLIMLLALFLPRLWL